MNKLSKLFFALSFLFFTVQGNAQAIPSWKATDLQTAIQNATEPTVFNFWATFCKPCLEELPYFEKIVKQYADRGVKLVLVNLDTEDVYNKRLVKFAQKLKIEAPVKWLNETDADIFCPVVDSQWSGAIPASLFVNNQTGFRSFFEDQLSKEQLEDELKKMTASK